MLRRLGAVTLEQGEERQERRGDVNRDFTSQSVRVEMREVLQYLLRLSEPFLPQICTYLNSTIVREINSPNTSFFLLSANESPHGEYKVHVIVIFKYAIMMRTPSLRRGLEALQIQ